LHKSDGSAERYDREQKKAKPFHVSAFQINETNRSHVCVNLSVISVTTSLCRRRDDADPGSFGAREVEGGGW
jgi:hypothetical protein